MYNDFVRNDLNLVYDYKQKNTMNQSGMSNMNPEEQTDDGYNSKY